ncbi:MAG: hypothetical protein U9R75_12790 [Candidatus Thermoplasmatota archaeon]|nr:hypothetical protein [Candidatus Thermoplasmatota archaeon]
MTATPNGQDMVWVGGMGWGAVPVMAVEWDGERVVDKDPETDGDESDRSEH